MGSADSDRGLLKTQANLIAILLMLGNINIALLEAFCLN